MNTPTTPRLVFFTVAVLAGAIAIFTDQFTLPGILLIGFSSIILMSKSDQKKHWTKPLTKRQILCGFIPLIFIFSVFACMIVIHERGTAESEATLMSISFIFKIVFAIALVFMLGQLTR